MTLARGSLLLFQGDSITDGARGRTDDPNHILGHGYVFNIAARVGADRPDLELRFCNRGISGNRVVDLYARWKEDTINLAPDLLSILVGVNDVGSGFARNSGVSAERFEKVYRIMLEETLEALPSVKLVLCDPFVLPVGDVKTRWPEWRHEVDLRLQAVRRLAADLKAVHVPFQDVLDQALARAAPEYWVWDGVHPLPAGHELLCRAWLDAVSLE